MKDAPQQFTDPMVSVMIPEPLMRKRLEPFLKKLNHSEMFKELHGAPDRVVAIVTFAYLDEFLRQSVRSHFQDSSRTVDDMFKPSGILGSFEARRRVGYGLGLYGKKTFKDLETLDHIRNKFAHRHDKVQFTDASIKKLHFPSLVRLYHPTEHIKPSPRETYIRTTRLLAGLLLSEATDNSPRYENPDIFPGNHSNECASELAPSGLVASGSAARLGASCMTFAHAFWLHVVRCVVEAVADARGSCTPYKRRETRNGEDIAASR